MPGWEYKHYQPGSMQSWRSTIADMNALGAAGWEVVGVWGTDASGVTIFILKRPRAKP